MKPLAIINAIGCVLLLGLAVIQWLGNEGVRQQYLQQQKDLHQAAQQRDEAKEKAAALQTDIASLKQAIIDTQKAAEAASQAALEREEQYKATASASQTIQTERDTAVAERDALKARTTEWENALKERDATITRLNNDMVALRKKLDEAIAQLKKAGAR